MFDRVLNTPLGLTLAKETVPVDTPRRFNVYKTSIRRRRRRIDVL